MNSSEMSKLYIHEVSGDIAPLPDWFDDYRNMDKESWHGKEIEECVEENWLVDGKLILVETALEIMESLDAAGYESDQDWENETTTWHLPTGARVVISGDDVQVTSK